MVALMRLRSGVAGFALAALLLCVALPAQAGTVYSWRTEDGTEAFTDDPKRIPERYRSNAEARKTGDLGDYAKLSRTEGDAERIHAARLSHRLDRLRSFNAYQPPYQPTAYPAAAPSAAFGGRFDAVTPTVVARDVDMPRLSPADAAIARAYEGLVEVAERALGVDDGSQPAGGPPAGNRVATPRGRVAQQFVPSVNFAVDPSSEAPVIVEKKRMRDRDTMTTRHITVVRQGDRILGVIKPRSFNQPVMWGDEEDLEKY